MALYLGKEPGEEIIARLALKDTIGCGIMPPTRGRAPCGHRDRSNAGLRNDGGSRLMKKRAWAAVLVTLFGVAGTVPGGRDLSAEARDALKKATTY
jgi:hypothetical protein